MSYGIDAGKRSKRTAFKHRPGSCEKYVHTEKPGMSFKRKKTPENSILQKINTEKSALLLDDGLNCSRFVIPSVLTPSEARVLDERQKFLSIFLALTQSIANGIYFVFD